MANNDPPLIILTDADGMEACADEAALIVVSFSHREVMACRVGDAVDRLMTLSDRRDWVLKFEDRVIFQFEGFDDDPREIGAIPECRAFFAAVAEQWPYWLHFTAKFVPLIHTALLLLTPPATPLGQRPGWEPKDVAKSLAKLDRGLVGLYQGHRLSEAHLQGMRRKVAAALEAART